MAPATTIVIEGEASIFRHPERGILIIDIRDEDYAKEAVSSHVVTTANHLSNEIEKLCRRREDGTVAPEAPVAYYSMSTLATSSRPEYDATSRPTGKTLHTAYTSLEVRFRDFPKVGEVASMISSAAYVTIRGVEWKLTTESEKIARFNAREDALRDALRKAKSYGEIIGRQNITVVKIDDNGRTKTRSTIATMQQASQQYQPASSSSSDLGLNFKPQQVIFQAAMEVEFQAE